MGRGGGEGGGGGGGVWEEGQSGERWGRNRRVGGGVMGGGTEGWSAGRGQLTFCTHTGPLGFRSNQE